jgi:FKBP-type peptidyl-prolyl cis-trans isomerase
MTITNTGRAMRFAIAAALIAAPSSHISAAPKKPAKPAPPVLTCKLTAKDGLTYTVIKPGKGEKPGANAKVTVDYRGMLKSDGTEFDAGKAAKFKVGGVIPGFAQGLQLMQPGGKYRLCIPAAIGYGENGTGPIPPNADLVFEVDLISFETPPPKPIIPAEARACNQKTASGLNYAIEKPGSGSNPTAKDVILIDMTAFNPATGEILGRNDWEKVPMASSAAPFTEAFTMMAQGATYRFCMAEVKEENGENRPAVTFRIDLLGVRPAPVED